MIITIAHYFPSSENGGEGRTRRRKKKKDPINSCLLSRVDSSSFITYRTDFKQVDFKQVAILAYEVQ